MKPHTAILFAIGIIFLSSCKKLDEEVQGYFFIQNADNEQYTLYINDKEVGILEESPVIPLICFDSTLVQTTLFTIENKKNNFVLENANGEKVASGKFTIKENSFSSSSEANFGATYVNHSREQNSIIMGFNVDEPVSEYTNQCVLE
ncbi:hypothetical protein N9P66_00025 [Salibacteraceae bacterium]|jgi:hypothetical protein|nr:hypothetical protein [Salibacteraceae bacterium]MDB0002430.1 hypothetical protein [Salibacteraceae bacterium]MDB4104518.1 hypothetical protein [Salibacteraceae bacterium]MDC1304767.1 hypothetical protein [Salibacteraceae bacterium]HAQ70158.1 hypothetical protein [Flavobacteriales bacterium]